MNIALIIAGGVGQRMRQNIPKQFLNVDNIPVIVYTTAAFQKHPEIDAIEIVCIDGWHDVLYAYAKLFGISKLENVVSGGKNGQDSIRNGLIDISKRHGKFSIEVQKSEGFSKPKDCILDNSELCKLGWHGLYGIKEGIIETLDIFKQDSKIGLKL